LIDSLPDGWDPRTIVRRSPGGRAQRYPRPTDERDHGAVGADLPPRASDRTL